MEKRFNERRQVTHDVDVMVNDYLHVSTQTRDLALNGAFLELGKTLPPPPGTEINLVFRNTEPAVVEIVATVARLAKHGIGCRFEHIGSTQLAGLRKLLVSV